mgnify:CR=1 FL=1
MPSGLRSRWRSDGMEWPKLKNIILILLIFTNVCLLVLVGGPAWQERQFQQQTRAEAIQFLNQKGISLAEEVVPERVEPTPQVARRNVQQEQLKAQAVLGQNVRQEIRGGEVYRYENEKGAIQFHSDGAFSLQMKPEAFPIREDPRQAVLTLLEKLGMDVEILEQTQYALTVRQVWQGSAVLNREFCVEWDEMGLTRITNGSRLVGTPTQVSGSGTITVATALITFLNGMDELGDVCGGIREITQGYTSSAPLSGPMELTPVWRIATDAGVYQLDMVSGQLSRIS